MASSPQQQKNQLYSVEHLATFSTMSQQTQTTPKMALQRLFAMEKTSGIWTQRMSLQVDGSNMKIIDGDSSETVERFPVTLIHQPTAFNHSNHIYDNILIFTIQHPDEAQGELHIFQCSSHSAQQVAGDISDWMMRHGNHSTVGPGGGHSSDPNVNVKEAVHVFNAIAAQRETRKSASPVSGQQPPPQPPSHNHHHSSRTNGKDQVDSRSIITTSSIDSSNHNGAGHRANSNEQSLSNERYVSILNHCFDDIERFIIRLQHAAAALRELQLRNHKRGGGKGHAPQQHGDGLLAMRARGPSEEEFFEILSKFKLAFNLLAKLKGCIHDPNAPELVHFLFTPLAIIIEAARSNGPNPVDPAAVGMPYLNAEAVELLSNCCTSKEYDLWQSVGPNWTQHARQHIVPPSRMLPATFQPVFTDGWAPTITEPELMGFTSSSDVSEEDEAIPIPVHVHRHEEQVRRSQNYDDSEDDGVHHHVEHHRSAVSNGSHAAPASAGHHHHHQTRLGHSSSPSPIESIGRNSPAAPLSDLEQSEWLQQLHERNAKIVRVLFPRTANNDKELTVVRGEVLEIIDDSRKWWKARNWRGHIAHVPHTIVTELSSANGGGGGGGSHLGGHGGGRESRGSQGAASPNEDWLRKERLVKSPLIGSYSTPKRGASLISSRQQQSPQQSQQQSLQQATATRNGSGSQEPRPPPDEPSLASASAGKSGYKRDVRASSRSEPASVTVAEVAPTTSSTTAANGSTVVHFQDELMETLRKRALRSSGHLHHHRQRADPVLTLPLVATHLFNKGFNREFIAHLMAVVCVLADKVEILGDPCNLLLNASRDQLAGYLSDHPSVSGDELGKLHESLQELKGKTADMKQIVV